MVSGPESFARSKEIVADILQQLKIITVFALFQGGFTLIGWLLGTELYIYIERFDHWIAFFLLAYIGGGMLFEGRKEECSCSKSKTNLLDNKNLCLLSIATSIDALAVGISLAMVSLSPVKILVGLISIFFFTALASFVGLNGGRSIGDRLGRKPEMLGGAILLIIGIKILIEHLVF